MGPLDAPELAPADGTVVAGDELVPSLRGFDDDPVGRVPDADVVPPVAVAAVVPVARVPAGAVFGRESGVC